MGLREIVKFLKWWGRREFHVNTILNPRSPAICGGPPQVPRELLALHWDPFGGDELLDQTRLLPQSAGQLPIIKLLLSRLNRPLVEK
ncbi:hypothetical protein [[Eubacterium] cellulosolvens]